MPLNVVEARDDNFESVVLERSKLVPVVVDFWAPWCGPCRVIGPVLERLADEYDGRFVLVKVNVDDSPALSQAFRVQSIPMVIGFRDGRAVAEFVGALPEAAVREFLQQVLPSPADQKAVQAQDLLSENKLDEAETLLRAALELEPRCERAHLGMARVHADRGETAEALTHLDSIAPGPLRGDADRLAAEVRIAVGAGADVEQLRKAAQTNPANLDARLALAQALAADRRYADALAEYLEVVRRNRTHNDGAARKAMIDIFDLLGSGDPTVERYRGELARVLFS